MSDTPEVTSKIVLSVQVVRSDKAIPFESKIDIPLDGRDLQPVVAQWLGLMDVALTHLHPPKPTQRPLR